MTADNCCQVRNTALKVFPNIDVVQDVWHFLMRYLVCVKDGTKNPHRGEVAKDIVDAILKMKAANGVPAVYRSQEEQEERLVEAYNKWKERGGVWTAAAERVHAKQLTHVKKGCLTRPRDDIATDGSRIEGSHKGWNSIMRAFPSGLEVMNALGHDHVLRHNVRLDMQDDSLDKSMFMYYTYGSHHIHLTNACIKLWNTLVEAQRRSGPQPADIRTLPELRPADSREKFGLVKMSAETATQYSLATIKQEPGDQMIDLSLQDMLDPDRILEEIGVDPALLNVPVPESLPQQPEDPTPNTWFPAALISSTSVVPTPTAGALSTTPSSALSTTPSSALSTTLSSALATTPSNASALPASRAPAATPSDASVLSASGAPTPAHKSSAPVIAASPALAVATPSAPAISTSANAPPAIPPVLDGPPPKKKACLTVAGMPPPMKSRQNGAGQDGSLSSTTARKQFVQPQNTRGTLDAMFAHIANATATGPHATFLAPTPTNEPCLPSAAIVGLTRSQRLFSVVTQVDPRALTFSKGGSSREFYLFMKLRATHKWATFQMLPYDWVCAASTYNTAIKDLNREHGAAFPLKTPRALLDKLSVVEAQIFGRIRDNNYRSRSGRTEFWEYHSKAVYLGSKIQRMVDDDAFKMGKNHVCGRCKRIMYPEGKNHKENHSRNVCSDGVRQSPEKVHLVINGISRDFVEQPPPFPQPKDIFTDGNIFHPARFMEVVRTFYDRIVINHSAPGALAMYDYAFAALLYDRTVIVPRLDGRPSKVIFKLFHSFTLAPGEAAVLNDHEAETYLRMDCLSEPPLEVMQDAAAVGGLPGAPEGVGLA
ncbi:hypothetical protein LXA43DRAFT_901577 [Ganoderma leucocontextum]|nr:hypothetical protein LXA43DRAFT_901577 [Ganoderma leucocontextum]